MVVNQEAWYLRETTGTNAVAEAALAVASALAHHGIAHPVAGGMALLRRTLPRDLAVQPVVRELYLQTWDALQAEK